MKTLKQTAKWVFGLTLLAGMIMFFPLLTKADKSGDYWYVVLGDGTAEISSYSGKETNLSIPDKLDGHTVKCIRDGAFSNLGSLESVKIPNGVTSIGIEAFSSCSNLKNIIIPDSVASIGKRAFWSSGLESIIIPNGVKSIEDETFSLTNLKSITIPTSVTSIGTDAFNFCRKLTSITIPKGVTSIRRNTFNFCSSLKSITIPTSVTSIEDMAFYGCNNLKDVYYAGSISQRNKIKNCAQYTANDSLFNAKWHYAVKSANPMKVKISKITFKRSKLKKAILFSIGASKAKGPVTYALDKKAKKAKIKVNSKGKVMIPKKCKKGIYKITVKAAGNGSYNPGKKVVTIKVK